ncbi:MAG: 2'-5' RNA ligase family protein [Chloroflexales bacterium]|nr:2'-5' RNA ligase family protein [Chloroflexales bacterium]
MRRDHRQNAGAWHGTTVSTSALPVHLDLLGIFPESGVLFLAPRMSQTLFSLYRRGLDAIAASGKPGVITELLLPDRWTPHCTLLGELTSAQLLTAIEAYQRRWAPIHGVAVGIGMRLWPSADDHRFSLFRLCDATA